MNQLHCIVYFSTSTRPVTDAYLTALLAESREFNSRRGVTGALLCDEGEFCQYLEGPRAGVTAVYARIQAATSHHRIIQVLDETIPERRFASWHMGFARAPRSIFLRLAQAKWMEAAVLQEPGEPLNAGVAVLLDFWRNLRGVAWGSVKG